jgi:hypothetical protein
METAVSMPDDLFRRAEAAASVFRLIARPLGLLALQCGEYPRISQDLLVR